MKVYVGRERDEHGSTTFPMCNLCYTHTKLVLIKFIHMYNLFVIFVYVYICTYYTYICSNYDSLLKYNLIHQRRTISWTYSGFFLKGTSGAMIY